MEDIEYKILKEEYIEDIESRIKSKTLRMISKTSELIAIILTIVLVSYFGFFNIVGMYCVLAIICVYSINNKKNLIIIRLIIYRIKEKKDKLNREIEWNESEFNVSNNSRIIIKSYNNIEEIIEYKDYIILVCKSKAHKYLANKKIIIPKKAFNNENKEKDFKKIIISRVGKENYKISSSELEKTIEIGMKEYLKVTILLILLIVVVFPFIYIII